MTRDTLFQQIKTRRSFLCIGLDSDLDQIPRHLLQYKDPVLEFNREIIDATHDLCVSFKANLAFYESRGKDGWECLDKTVAHIPDGLFTIADAKRGDIGNTSRHYARAFFGQLNFDAVTVTPYMGSDSVLPFLEYPGKWVILLGLTSNEGAGDFQLMTVGSDGNKLFEEVIQKSRNWGTADNMMYVAGATRPGMLANIRALAPDHFLLVPGVGAQGGSLAEVASLGMNDRCGLLVNASRSIIYAGQGKDFAEKAREEAMKIQEEMAALIDGRGW